MAIKIRHRFYERLTPALDKYKFINTIIIGTFNPGLPDKIHLEELEKQHFEKIEVSPKFQKFNLVSNFYDRPQNRFWGVMDRLANPKFYADNGINARNQDGLKFYKGMNRKVVFEKQQDFCVKAGIFITDIVNEINPLTFESIYDNFPDTKIEAANPVWHTTEIIETIKMFDPKKILINFRTDNPAIPKIGGQAKQIKNSFSSITTSVLSTSGAATNDYPSLMNDWQQHIFV